VSLFCLFTSPPTTASSTLSLHDALPILALGTTALPGTIACGERGDCRPDGSIDLFDVLDDIDIVLGRRQPDAAESILCDVQCDRSEEHTSELQSRFDLVCRLLLEKKNNN